MLKTELKKAVSSLEFFMAILLLYISFLLGRGGLTSEGDSEVSILSIIWNKIQGRWIVNDVNGAAVIRMNEIWNDNLYLAVIAPVIFGIPFISKYVEEVSTQNKRFILVRTDFKQYCLTKMMVNIFTCILISFLAVLLYDVTIFLFYEHLSDMDHEQRSLICDLISGENSSVRMIYIKIIKSTFYFMLYSVMCGAFVCLITVISRDRYITLGTVILICYIQYRIVEELRAKGFAEENVIMRRTAQVLDPMFLGAAGNYGFYEKREWLAVIISIGIILFFYGMVYVYWSKQTDLSER